MRKVITDEMKTDISRMYKEGYGVKSIAEKFNLAISTIRRYTQKPESRRFNSSVTVGKIEENKKIRNEREKRFAIGDKLIITGNTRSGSDTGDNRKRKYNIRGKVVFSNYYYFVVKMENYKESYKYADILAGDIEVKKVRA